MPRGGVRNGRPGVAYPNRADLNAPRPLAPTAAPGQQYGAAGAQLAAQAAVPMAPQALPSVPGGGQNPPAQAPGGAAPSSQPPGPAPGSLGAFARPTERPGEPVTSGLPIGPGPGPEAVPGFAQRSAGTLGDLLAQMAATPHASPEVQALAAYVGGGRR